MSYIVGQGKAGTYFQKVSEARNTSLEQSCSVLTTLGEEIQGQQEEVVYGDGETMPRLNAGKRSHDSLCQTTSKEYKSDKSDKVDVVVEEQEQEGQLQKEDQHSLERPQKKRKVKKVEHYDEPVRDQEEIVRPDVPKRCCSHKLRVRDKQSGPYLGSGTDGHLKFQYGMSISQRYKIMEKMGQGTFGQVFNCWDRVEQRFVAVKVIRNVKKYRDAAMIELKVLETIKQNDVQGKWHCVKVSGWFERQGHVCMVFEKLGPSVFEFLQRNGYRGFPLRLVRSVVKQVLEAVAYMHELTLIHTDLKPENILLINDDYVKEEREDDSRIGKRVPVLDQVKVIDFGSAHFDDDYHSTVVQTRHYRAPEVILGLGWTYPCDIWSVGCILYELIVGEALFQTRNNLEHLAMMEKILGKIPEVMIRQSGETARKYFTRSKQLDWNWKKSTSSVRKLQALRKLIRDRGDRHFAPFINEICDLTERMLRYDPVHRITAKQALAHQFFQMDISRENNEELISKNRQDGRNNSFVETDYNDLKTANEQTPKQEKNRSQNPTLTARQIYDNSAQNPQLKFQQQQQQYLQIDDDQLEKENNQIKISDDIVCQKEV
eukprot:TRINITY_DN3686_c1_g3_i1.p1 TRINITY_DN3686_c1_g3~~TRINITY_DN3686_c1_g3_i1.p1  ORF type:complete len:601 (-),score=73.69 TRINITY_DN3686_c1_g3_i1:368-2170(-)